MQHVAGLIGRMAGTDVAVLIRGESGAGKEVAARAIHNASPRRDNPFVKVDCTAMPAALLEAELFGFERGATGAALRCGPGKLEFAHTGTVFLDEIGALGEGAQEKLLRLIQERRFTRLGGSTEVAANVRILTSTSRDLEQAVSTGRFREDLFFCLNVVSITVPPLRQRRDDILPLAQMFVDRYARRFNTPPIALGPEAERLLLEHAWPGNVRELEDCIKRAVTVGTDAILVQELRPAVAPHTPENPPALAEGGRLPSLRDIGRSAARLAERELIFRTLQQTRWNRRAAAALLGVSYKALLYKIKDAEAAP